METSASQDATSETTTTTPPTTTPTVPAGDGLTGHHGQPGTGTTRPKVVTAELPAADGGCLATDVTVTPAVAGRPRSGTDVAFALSVATTGASACRMELSSDVLLLKVSTGGQPVWDTEQCPGAVSERTVVLRPGWTTSVIVTWPGVYGDKTCTGTTRDAPPGSYAVEAAVYEGEPGRTDFELEPPVTDHSGHDGNADGADDEARAGRRGRLRTPPRTTVRRSARGCSTRPAG